jgi:hypothetical protein
MPIELLSNLAQKNRSANVSSSAFFYLMDSSNIDYRIKGIQLDNTLVPTLENNAKYIIKNTSSLHPDFSGPGGAAISGLQNNDIVVYQTNGFYLYVDVSNLKTDRGHIAFNDADNKLYYYNSVNWVSLGLGSLFGTPNQIQITGFTGDRKISLTPTVIIQNIIQTPTLMFLNGLTMGGTGDSIQVHGNLNIKGNLLVDGEIVTKSVFRGYTLDSELEGLEDIAVDAGDY